MPWDLPALFEARVGASATVGALVSNPTSHGFSTGLPFVLDNPFELTHEPES